MSLFAARPESLRPFLSIPVSHGATDLGRRELGHVTAMVSPRLYLFICMTDKQRWAWTDGRNVIAVTSLAGCAFLGSPPPLDDVTSAHPSPSM